MAEVVRLKKYANRRLYDTEKSKYVTLNQVAEMIKKGRQISVIDATTEDDVTTFILTQIILEEARKKNALLPDSILHLIIQYGDNILGEFFEKYFQQTITNYLKSKAAFEEHFKNWLDLGMDISGMTPKSIMESLPFKSFMDFFPHPPQPDDTEKEE